MRYIRIQCHEISNLRFSDKVFISLAEANRIRGVRSAPLHASKSWHAVCNLRKKTRDPTKAMNWHDIVACSIISRKCLFLTLLFVVFTYQHHRR
jgi:hypothetical protein